jgi:four helix bundle protein
MIDDGELMMKSGNEILDLSFSFAVRIVNLYKYLNDEKKEYVLSRQLLRSGTSIGANVTESQDAQSRKDFVSKLSISLKEAKETRYWIKLLIATNYLPENHKNVLSIQNDLDSIIKLLTSILKSTKSATE